MTLLDTPHAWKLGIPGSMIIAPYLTLPTDKSGGFLVRRPLRRILGLGVLHNLPKREFPCALRYIYSVQHFRDECNFFANPTKALCIPIPERWGFTAYSITKTWLVNG